VSIAGIRAASIDGLASLTQFVRIITGFPAKGKPDTALPGEVRGCRLKP